MSNWIVLNTKSFVFYIYPLLTYLHLVLAIFLAINLVLLLNLAHFQYDIAAQQTTTHLALIEN